MDSTDKQLLAALAKNAKAPLKELSNLVHLSASAVAARIERMEDSGIILGYRAQINQALFAHNIEAFISVSMSPANKLLFKDFVAAQLCVHECYNVTGNASMLIKVAFDTTEELDEFVRELQKFGQTVTQVVLNRVVEPHSQFY